MKTALLAGASGLVGSEVLKFLLEDSRYGKVIMVGRKKIEVSHPKLEQIIVDFDNLEQVKDKIKADEVFCCLGTTMKKAGSKENFYQVDYFYPVKLAEISLSNSATKYILVTAMGADKQSALFYNRVKGEVEEAIAKMDFETTIILRPSLILGERKEKRLGEDFAKALAGPLSFVLVGPIKKYKPIEAFQIAEGMIKLAHKDLKGVYIFESEEIKAV